MAGAVGNLDSLHSVQYNPAQDIYNQLYEKHANPWPRAPGHRADLRKDGLVPKALDLDSAGSILGFARDSLG